MLGLRSKRNSGGERRDSSLNYRLLPIGAVVLILTALSVESWQAKEGTASTKGASTIPVIYTTDLFHPHDDPDDHFDLATIFAMPEVDLKGIVLDQGDKQLKRPGAIPVTQMNEMTGRNVPTVLGLTEKLKSPTDKALDQKPEFQKGVEFILDTLTNSPSPVVITTIGSVRDVVAAYNRNPALFKDKVAKLLVFIGEASNPSFQEYNVKLDLHAYVGLMRSGLPIYWVPCFDGGIWKNAGQASFWNAKHEDLFRKASPELIQFFIYALQKENSDPLAFLSSAVDPQRQAQLFAGTRNLWCMAIFGVLSGREVTFDGTKYRSGPSTNRKAQAAVLSNDLFGFSEVDISVSDDGIVRYGKSRDSKKVMRFEVRNKAKYAEGMTAMAAELLSKVKEKVKFGK